MLFKLLNQCAGGGTFQTLNRTTLKCVSFLYRNPSLRVEQGRQGPSEIPLCVGLESFCVCELYIKRSWAAAGSLKWERGVSELNTGLCLDMFRPQYKNSSAKGLLRMAQDQGWGLISLVPFLSDTGWYMDTSFILHKPTVCMSICLLPCLF